MAVWGLQVKAKGSRRINFGQFVTALAAAAEARNIPLADAVKKVIASGGPATTGTRANYVKFHDDKVRCYLYTCIGGFIS